MYAPTLARAAENAVDMVNIDILNASVVAVLGYAVVFFGIILLMVVIMAIGKVFIARENRKKAAAPAAVEAEPAPEAAAPTAPGAAGSLKLYNVEPKTAAMIMAIVAEKLGKPLNELRFLSIKEVE